ncbi:NAD-dependent epimerase/dehydratase family protein [uncultured Muriicola sp.]|uniref:NAD-dependent epimerase/dehydratase family protein n=1 Tax=uncultured Muriicola sp. TaxID=1583102 RepID=UPI00262BFE97|nr:NAD-dependent epimerase/dehydratase family protein [uncultured Muriicola sp.]
MILVTGGTGLLGSHLLWRLVQKEVPVKAIYRSEGTLKEVKTIFSYYTDKASNYFDKITWIKADITDVPSLEEAFVGVTHVYHTAALLSFNPAAWESLKKINVEGTANIVNLCIAHNIEKLCYASSIAAIGKSLDETTVTEKNEWLDSEKSVYALSKHRAEMEVWRGSQEGLKVVIVNPGIILGPGNWDHGSLRLFKNAAKGMRSYFPGGTAFVSANDVASIMTQLMHLDIYNERYIAIAKNMSYQELFTMIASSFEVRIPTKKIPFWLLETGWRIDWLIHLFLRTRRKLIKITVKSLRKRQLYSSQKLEKTLGFNFETMDKCIDFSCNIFKKRYPDFF